MKKYTFSISISSGKYPNEEKEIFKYALIIYQLKARATLKITSQENQSI